MLSDHKKVKMVLGMKFQDKTKSKQFDNTMQKMIVGTCEHFPNFRQVKPLPLPEKKLKRINCCFASYHNIIVTDFLH